MHEAELVEQTARRAHALDAVVGGVVVRAIEQVETERLEIRSCFGRAELPVAAGFHLRPALELR